MNDREIPQLWPRHMGTVQGMIPTDEFAPQRVRGTARFHSLPLEIRAVPPDPVMGSPGSEAAVHVTSWVPRRDSWVGKGNQMTHGLPSVAKL